MKRYTIGKRTIKPAFRNSVWLTNNLTGKYIYKVIRFISHWLGYKTRIRYRRPTAGNKYGMGGSLRRDQAENFSVYFDKIIVYRFVKETA